MLKHTTDFYDGVTIDETTLPESVDEFKSMIEKSLEEWRSAGKKGVWLKVRVFVHGLRKSECTYHVYPTEHHQFLTLVEH